MDDAFLWEDRNGVIIGRFPALEERGLITQGFSSRIGGFSQGDFESLNLAYNSGDDACAVRNNYEIFASALDVQLKNVVLSHQTHDTHIRKVTPADQGKGVTIPRDYEAVDGLITNESGIPLMTFHADCVPLYFVDPVKQAIGLAHAGWRGTANQMASKMIREMKKAFGTQAKDLKVAIGPSIDECCFIIRDDVRRVLLSKIPFAENVLTEINRDQWKVSLQKINQLLLIREGVATNRIYVAGVCTCCHKELLFSHRAHGNKRGTMAALLQINHHIKKEGVVNE